MDNSVLGLVYEYVAEGTLKDHLSGSKTFKPELLQENLFTFTFFSDIVHSGFAKSLLA